MAGYADLGKLVIEIVAKDSEARKKIAGMATECETMAKKTKTAMGNVSTAASNMDKSVAKSAAKTQSQFWQMANSASAVGVGFTSLGRLSTRVGSMILMNVTAPLAAAGASAATTAINFLTLKENARISFETLLGSAEAATKMMDELYAFAKTTPFSQETFYNAGKTLLAMGYSAKEVKSYLEGMTNAAIATGAGQAGIDTLTHAFGKMRSMGRITLEGLNMLTDMGIPAIKILANEYGKTEQEMFDMIHSGEVLSEKALPKLLHGMQEGTKGAAGMTAAYGGLAEKMKSGTLTGALDSLHSAWRNMSVELFDAENNYPKLIELVNKVVEVVPKFAKVFSGVTDSVGPALDFVIDKLDQLSKTLDSMSDEELKKIGDTILAIAKAGPALVIFGGALKVIGSAFRGAAGIFRIAHEMEKIKAKGKGANGVLKTMGTNLKKVAVGANNACGKFLKFINPLKSLGGATKGLHVATGAATTSFAPLAIVLAGIIAVVVALRRHWDTIVKIFKDFAERIKLEEKLEKIKEAFNRLMDSFRGSGEGGSLLQSLGDIFAKIGEVILLVLTPAIDVLMGLFDGVISALPGIIDALSGVVDFIRGFLDVLAGIVTFDKERIIEGFKTMGNGILKVFSGLWDAVVGFVEGFIEGIVEFFGSLKDNVGPALGEFKDKVVEFFSGLGPAIMDKIDGLLEIGGNIVDGIGEGFMSALSSLGEWASSLFDGLVNGIKSIFGIASPAANMNFLGEEMVNGIKEGWDNIVDTAAEWGSGLWNSVKNGFETVKEGAVKIGSGLANKVKDGVETVKEKAQTAGKKLGTKVKEGVSSVKEKAKSAGEFLANKVKDGVSFVKDKVSAAGQALGISAKSGVESKKGGLNSAGQTLGTSAKSGLEGVKSRLHGAGELLGRNVRNGLSGTKSIVSSAAQNLANAAKSSISNVFSRARTWASHLVDNLAAGLRAGVGEIGSAAGALADKIAEKLQHTVPKAGPLKTEMEWMPHMVSNLTNTLRDSSPELLGAVDELAGDMAETLAIGDMNASRNFASTMQVNTDSNMSGMMGQMMGMMQVMIGKMNPQYQVVLDTGVVAGAMTPRIDRNLGVLNNRRSKGL